MGCKEGMASIPFEFTAYVSLYFQLPVWLTWRQGQCEANALNEGNQIWVCNRVLELPGIQFLWSGSGLPGLTDGRSFFGYTADNFLYEPENNLVSLRFLFLY